MKGKNENFFSDDFQTAPFWWSDTPREKSFAQTPPRKTDVLIIGSGYTGLNAAIQTSPSRETVVLDAEHAGWGCSTRNGGQVSTSIKPDFARLAKRFGARIALDILHEGNRALDWVEDFVAANNINCDFRRAGRFYGAHSPAAFAQLQKRIDAIPRELNSGAYVLARDAQGYEIASDFYHGGAVYPKHAALHPARYHRGLLHCAQQRGAKIIAHCAAQNIAREKNGFVVQTENGNVRAREIVLATSGYTGELSPWQRRRIIPVASYIIATEELPPEVAHSLLPNMRVVTDSRRLVVYYRLCPRRKHILFGGRVSAGDTNLRASALQLREQMLRIFPQLNSARISHSWMGWVGYTFDELPHLGARDGLHFAMGYCGSGISLASYCGMKTGLRVLGDSRARTALARPAFPARPYYRRRPWFLPPAGLYYRWRDEWEVRRGQK